MKNHYLILISILIALTIWLNIVLLMEQTATISLRIKYINLPDEYPLSSLPAKAKFLIVGDGYHILKLKLTDFKIEYDASEIESSTSEINPKFFLINDNSVKGISSIEPLSNDLTQNQDKMLVSKLPIELIFSNRAASQMFNDKKYKLEQDIVEVQGPENVVREFSKIETQPITTNMLKKSKVILILVSPSKRAELLSKSVSIMQVDELTITKVFTRIPINNAGSFEFFPREVSVRISGLTSKVNTIEKSAIIAELLISKEINGVIPVEVKAPEEIDIIEISPDKVTKISNE